MSQRRARRAIPLPPAAPPPVLLAAALLALLYLVPAMAAEADAAPDYGAALSKSLLYFEAQRSGRLPYGQRVRWRGHSGLTDGLQQGVDLVGGYYDAGDHVKFGLPMAFTVTMLAWGALEFGDDVQAAGEWGHALEAIKWGTDYFVKAHTEPFVYWAEVGDGDSDHYCWQRPEDMTTSRQAYKVDKDNPGSDLVGETAAALAAASLVFRRSTEHHDYADLLLRHARQLFEFADTYRGNYDTSIKQAHSFYTSVSGYRDELLWAAFWLHRATGEDAYLRYAVDHARSVAGAGWPMTEFSWENKYAGLQVLAAKLLLDGDLQGAQHRAVLEQYKAKAEHYLCACLGRNNGSNVHRTPGGMLYVREWNNLQYASSAAFLLTVYSSYLARAGASLHCPDAPAPVPPSELLALARSQADYILGRNPLRMSYMVGYGARFPLRVHHRAASIVSHKADNRFIGCVQGFDDWFGRDQPNPNVLVGAIVGGPNRRDQFMDARKTYVQTEACTYNTAPMVAVFARLHRLSTMAAAENSSSDSEGCRPGLGTALSAKCR
ncbi:hypothetical protein QYE76_004946 [Lolium multiflorum]|uniref:Endoglucanase n=1 Tax=Lolium multiflorum TaxID=4521 RepID=A0AAD8W2Y2_LOLMU|nr:hypothetical protein QYE76_004946 [Lolium multiflorum]